jgi:hypothetical protein
VYGSHRKSVVVHDRCIGNANAATIDAHLIVTDPKNAARHITDPLPDWENGGVRRRSRDEWDAMWKL